MILAMLVEAAQQVGSVAPITAQHATAPDAVRPVFDTVVLGNFVGPALTTGLAMIGGYWAWKKERREQDKDNRDATDRIMAELGKVNSGLGERVKTLENKTHDFMTRAEINGAIEHEKGNRSQADRVLETWMGKLDEAQRKSNDDIVTLKEKARSSESAIQEIKALIKEQNAETKALIKEFAEENKVRFDQVCDSIREVRDVKAR